LPSFDEQADVALLWVLGISLGQASTRMSMRRTRAKDGTLRDGANRRAWLAWTDWQSVRRLPTCPTRN